MNYIIAFIVGGLICVLGQILLDRTNITSAKILCLFVVMGAVISAFNLYQPLVDFAGAGATVPLTGFGHALSKGAKEAVDEMGLIGAFIGGIKATGSGISAVILFAYINALIFKPKSK